MPRKANKKGKKAPTQAPSRPSNKSKRAPRMPKPLPGVVMMGSSKQTRTGVGNAPSAIGRRVGTVGYRVTDEAQSNTDQGRCPSVRITGSDIALVTIGAYSGYSTALSLSGAGLGANTKFGPAALSVRAKNLIGTYAWYAFRQLKVTFVPLVGPSSADGASSVNAASVVAVALASAPDSDSSSDGPSTFQQVMEIEPSVAFPAWEGATLQYRFDGTRLWTTSTNNAPTYDVNDKWQLAICGRWSKAQTGATAAQIDTHLMFVEYVIDCYRPQEPSAYPTVDRPLPLRQLRLELDTLARRLALAEGVDSEDERKQPDDPVLVSMPRAALGSLSADRALSRSTPRRD